MSRRLAAQWERFAGWLGIVTPYLPALILGLILALGTA